MTKTAKAFYAALGMSPAQFWESAFQHAAAANKRQEDDAQEEAFWREAAPAYDAVSPLAALADDLIRDASALLQDGDHLVEVGAGTGAFTRRLAPQVGRVTVVEPSAAMRTELAAGWATGEQPTIVPARWEDAPEMEADVVFCANAFYRMRDIEAALLRMQATARRHVILVQTIDPPWAEPMRAMVDGQLVERSRAEGLSDILDGLDIPHQYRTYPIPRDGKGVCRVALIDWRTAQGA